MEFVMVDFSCNADGYDPLDPNGNITIKWDIMLNNEGSQDVSFSYNEIQRQMQVFMDPNI